MLVEIFFLTSQPPVSVAPFPWQAPQHHVAEAPQTCTLGPWAPVLELLYLRFKSTKVGFFAWLKKTWDGKSDKIDWAPLCTVGDQC